MRVSSQEGGSLDFVQNGLRVPGEFYFSYRHFVPISGQLSTPHPLRCPADANRSAAASFARFNNENLSYFVGVNANPGNSAEILAGDRNIASELPGHPTILRQGGGVSVVWTRELHRLKGNLLYADGRVEEVNGPKLVAGRTLTARQDLVLPSIQSSPELARVHTPYSPKHPVPNEPVASEPVATAESVPVVTFDRAPPVTTDWVPRSPFANLGPDGFPTETNAPVQRSITPLSPAPAPHFGADVINVIRSNAWLLWLFLILLLLAIGIRYWLQSERKRRAKRCRALW
jgi:prepilin-type processing-associated H-X9-DG protein